MYSSGLVTLPRLLLILAPCWVSSPLLRRRLNGSSNGTCPRSCSAIQMKRLYIRCSTECSAPPTYMCTGSHFAVRAASKARSSKSADGYRRKYQAESRKLSQTSVSRRAGPPHVGQLVVTNSGTSASGDEPVARGVQSVIGGSSTGSASSGTGTVPHVAQ